jgi:hypothetical protein
MDSASVVMNVDGLLAEHRRHLEATLGFVASAAAAADHHANDHLMAVNLAQAGARMLDASIWFQGLRSLLDGPSEVSADLLDHLLSSVDKAQRWARDLQCHLSVMASSRAERSPEVEGIASMAILIRNVPQHACP